MARFHNWRRELRADWKRIKQPFPYLRTREIDLKAAGGEGDVRFHNTLRENCWQHYRYVVDNAKSLKLQRIVDYEKAIEELERRCEVQIDAYEAGLRQREQAGWAVNTDDPDKVLRAIGRCPDCRQKLARSHHERQEIVQAAEYEAAEHKRRLADAADLDPNRMPRAAQAKMLRDSELTIKQQESIWAVSLNNTEDEIRTLILNMGGTA